MSSAGPNSRAGQEPSTAHDANPDDVPIETLVEHLLSAKRSLSTMNSVLRANELCTQALHLYEEAVVLGSETEYLRRGMACQLNVLTRVRNGLNRTYDAGKREFRQLIRMMDGADEKMKGTISGLRNRVVEKKFREGQGDEGERNLMDFVDEKSVQSVVEALKGSVTELQVSHSMRPLSHSHHHLTAPLRSRSRRPSTAISCASKPRYDPSRRPSLLQRVTPRPPPPTSPSPPSFSP